MMKRTLDLEKIQLLSGSHTANNEQQMCIMEAVAYVAGEDWTDAPACASPVIAAFCRAWNDTPDPYGQSIRDRLRAYIPRLVSSRGTPEQEKRRAWLATDWMIRVCTPAWLRAAGLAVHAETLQQLPPQTSLPALESSAAARAAARDTAWDTAWAAARAAAWDALQPTVEQLQASAWQLLDAMLDCD